MPQKFIYKIQLVNGDIVMGSTRNKLFDNFKKYILDNNKIGIGWFFLTPSQIRKIIYEKDLSKKVKDSMWFIKRIDVLSAEDYFRNYEFPRKYNGRYYSPSYCKLMKTRYIKEFCEKIDNDVKPDSLLTHELFKPINVF